MEGRVSAFIFGKVPQQIYCIKTMGKPTSGRGTVWVFPVYLRLFNGLENSVSNELLIENFIVSKLAFFIVLFVCGA